MKQAYLNKLKRMRSRAMAESNRAYVQWETERMITRQARYKRAWECFEKAARWIDELIEAYERMHDGKAQNSKRATPRSTSQSTSTTSPRMEGTAKR